MRLVIEIARSAAGRFEGAVLAGGGGAVPVAFSGTLELLKVLEDSTSGPLTMDAAHEPEIAVARS